MHQQQQQQQNEQTTINNWARMDNNPSNCIGMHAAGSKQASASEESKDYDKESESL